MGRWDQYGERIDFNPGHSWYSYAKENSCAKAIIDAHNADCDAYEARIAELEAKMAQREKDVLYQSNNYQATHAKWEQSQRELARVKAESLRVVPDGKQDCVYCGGTDIECIHCYGYGKPVRLERWEEQG